MNMYWHREWSVVHPSLTLMKEVLAGSRSLGVAPPRYITSTFANDGMLIFKLNTQ